MKSLAATVLLSASLLSAQTFVTGQGARLVIGQRTFTQLDPGTATERLLGAVGGLAYFNDTLFVSDSSRIFASPQNHRVLAFRGISSQLPGPKDSHPWTDFERCRVCGGVANLVLGQTAFNTSNIGLTQDRFRTPTAVATDGLVLAVADTDNNRVLIWLNLPTRDGQPADVVVGQGDFRSNGINFGGAGATPSAKGLRSPQGLWIQDGKLYIADTQNNRVLIFNSIPRSNGATADLVLGQPNFTSFVQSDLVQATLKATPTNMLSPVSVSSDGRKLFVSDLGHNRVLIWNRIPTSNAQAVDVVIGQPDATSTDENLAVLANNSTKLCPSNGTDAGGNKTYPERCAATLDFPRYALSDGKRLYIADGGNDRILVYNDIPTTTGQAADVILGQFTENLNQDSDPSRISAADSLRSPTSLAWDGTNLYVADTFNRRIVAFTPGDFPLPITGVRNAASREIFAVGSINFTADPKTDDEVTVKIVATEYKYKTVKDDTVGNVVRALVSTINTSNNNNGDPNVIATANPVFSQVLLTARASGEAGNGVAYATTFSDKATLAGSGSGNLSGGQDAAKIAPGSLVIILGESLSETTVSAPIPNESAPDLPQRLGGVEVYIDGIRAPLVFVSPTEIRAQMPWEVFDASSVSTYVRKIDASGNVKISTAIAVPIIPQNPGIFAVEGQSDPRPALARHGSSYAIGVVSVDGTAKENDTASVSIEDRKYTYTVKKDDRLNNIRDGLVDMINGDERVNAEASSIYTRILLKSRIPGPEGEGITYSASAVDGANVIMTALGSVLCCAAKAGLAIDDENPARPGELISFFTTGLGTIQPEEAKGQQVTGSIYRGPADNTPNTIVDDAQVGGKTANVISARLVPGMVGISEVRLQLNTDIPTNPRTQMWIAQFGYISNIVSFPVVNPNPPAVQ